MELHIVTVEMWPEDPSVGYFWIVSFDQDVRPVRVLSEGKGQERKNQVFPSLWFLFCQIPTHSLSVVLKDEWIHKSATQITVELDCVSALSMNPLSLY